MAYRKEIIKQTECPNCHNQVMVFEEGEFQILDLHMMRDPITHNLTNCPQSRSLVTTHVREHYMMVSGI